jgi:hypothetical protein
MLLIFSVILFLIGVGIIPPANYSPSQVDGMFTASLVGLLLCLKD